MIRRASKPYASQNELVDAAMWQFATVQLQPAVSLFISPTCGDVLVDFDLR
jgi:hypothetical protein